MINGGDIRDIPRPTTDEQIEIFKNLGNCGDNPTTKNFVEIKQIEINRLETAPEELNSKMGLLLGIKSRL